MDGRDLGALLPFLDHIDCDGDSLLLTHLSPRITLRHWRVSVTPDAFFLDLLYLVAYG